METIKLCAAGILAFLVASPGLALCQDVDRAARLNDEGTALYERGEYQRASELFREAWEAYRESPDLLYNWISALRKAGASEQALRACRDYQSRFPQGEQAGRVQGIIDGLEAAGAGLALMGQGKLAEAKARFQRCLEIDPQLPECLCGLANALKGLGDLPGSRISCDRCAALAHQGELKAQAQACRAVEDASLSIEVKPPMAKIFLDGVLQAPSSEPVKVKPGERVLLLQAEGYVDREVIVTLIPGEKKVVRQSLQERAIVEPPSPETPAKGRVWSWVMVGLTGAIAGTAAVLGGVHLSHSQALNDYNQTQFEAIHHAEVAEDYGVGANVMWSLAAGAAAGALLAFLLE